MGLYSGFRNAATIRKERPLSNEELFHYVPSIFSEDKHESRSERYTYIPTITLLNNLRKEGFQPFFACQTKVKDVTKKEHTRHMLRLRRDNFIQSPKEEVPEIILLNSHDGSSSYQMIPGVFRFVCANGLVCGDTFADIRVPHKGDVVGRVIEGAYEVLNTFDEIMDSRQEMKAITLNYDEQKIYAETAIAYKYGEEYSPIQPDRLLRVRRREDDKTDLWTTYQTVQENLIKGGVLGVNKKGRLTRTRPVTSITGDVKLNKALWELAEKMKKIKS